MLARKDSYCDFDSERKREGRRCQNSERDFILVGEDLTSAKGRKQPERKLATSTAIHTGKTKWNPESEAYWTAHKTEHPETQSRAEKFVR